MMNDAFGREHRMFKSFKVRVGVSGFRGPESEDRQAPPRPLMAHEMPSRIAETALHGPTELRRRLHHK